MIEQIHTNIDIKSQDLANSVKCDTIKEILKKEITTLTDRQVEYVLDQLQKLIQNHV